MLGATGEQIEIFPCRVPFTSPVHFTPALSPPWTRPCSVSGMPVSTLGRLCLHGQLPLPGDRLRPDGDVLNP